MTKVTAFGGASAETLAQLLERHPDYRVQRRLRPTTPYGGAGVRPSTSLSGCAVDVETTGLDHRTDAVIELAMQRFRVDGTGRIVNVGPPFRWLEDPGVPIRAEITALTGIDDDAVAGRCIGEAEATGLLLDADFVIAHNAMFDRPFVERRIPLGAGRPWVCSMRDVDWGALGFEGRVLSHLLSQMGWFYDAHRADVDVTALLKLLSYVPDGRDTTVLFEAIRNASRPGFVVEAVRAPFDAKDLLKARGYRWDASRRHWWREVAEEALDEEIEWTLRNVYGGKARPRYRRTDWTRRYAAAESVSVNASENVDERS